MPLLYTSTTHPEIQIYAGFDKFENEKLIKYAWENDVWFHVDKFSSAHVYARLPEGMNFRNMPKDFIEEMAQLTKSKSIEGNKVNNVTVIWTYASNLLKTGDMDVGTVSFHNNKDVLRTVVLTKDKELVKKLEKSCKEDHTTDLEKAKIAHEKEIHKKERAEKKRREEEERRAAEERRKYIMEHDYSNLPMSTNNNDDEDFI